MPERTIVQSENRHKRGFLQRPKWGGGSYLPRVQAIGPLLAGAEVLDLGCASGRNRPDWVHAQLQGITTRVVGVDLDRAGVDELVARGFDVRYGDAERFRTDDRFDVVFAGEIIEHLDSVRGLFETARAHLRPGGSFVITTPNAFAFPNFVYRLGGSVRVNSDHTCWYCEDTLAQLVRREEFVVDDITYLKFRSHGRARGVAADLIRRLLPDRLAWSTLIAVCHPA